MPSARMQIKPLEPTFEPVMMPVSGVRSTWIRFLMRSIAVSWLKYRMHHSVCEWVFFLVACVIIVVVSFFFIPPKLQNSIKDGVRQSSAACRLVCGGSTAQKKPNPESGATQPRNQGQKI